MDNTKAIKAFMAQLNSTTADLSVDLSKLTSKSLSEQLLALDPADQLHHSNNYAYIVTSLLFAYLKSMGVDTKNHPIMAELERCKSYIGREKALKESLKRKTNEELEEERKLKRFVDGVLGEGSRSTAVTGVPERAISSGKHTKFEE